MGREKDEKVAGREQAGEAGNVHPTDAAVYCYLLLPVRRTPMRLDVYTGISRPVPTPDRCPLQQRNSIIDVYEDSDAARRVMSAARRDAPARSTPRRRRISTGSKLHVRMRRRRVTSCDADVREKSGVRTEENRPHLSHPCVGLFIIRIVHSYIKLRYVK